VNHAVDVDLTAFKQSFRRRRDPWILDGGSDHATTVSITTEGTHTLEYWGVDVAGNEETHPSATVLIDLSAPTITQSSRRCRTAGWNSTSVVVTFTCDGQPSCQALRLHEPADGERRGSEGGPGTAIDHTSNSF
jgi:hypothetical protein